MSRVLFNEKGAILYLYLGYFLVQLYPLIVKVFQLNISLLAVFYSFIVVVIWSFVPFLGYMIAKTLNAGRSASKYFLFFIGLGVGLMEVGLFYFDWLTNKQITTGTLFAFLMFFAVAFLPINKVTKHSH